jgi:hypothetical protein
MDFAAYYESLIQIQRKAIRSWWVWVICVVLGGAAIVIGSMVFASGATSDLIKLGGAFIGVCAAYPYKEIPPRRERIASYTQLKHFFETATVSDEEKRQLFMNLTADAFRGAMQRGPNA